MLHGEPRQAAGLRAWSSAGCRATKNPAERTGPGFAHFCTQKASGDKAVTSGDELSGLEFAGFSGQKTDFGARRTHGTGFRRKTSEFGGPGTTFDAGHEKRTFRSSPFSALFAPKMERRRSGDIASRYSFRGSRALKSSARSLSASILKSNFVAPKRSLSKVPWTQGALFLFVLRLPLGLPGFHLVQPGLEALRALQSTASSRG